MRSGRCRPSGQAATASSTCPPPPARTSSPTCTATDGGCGWWPRMSATAVAAMPTWVAAGPALISSPAPNPSTRTSAADATSLRDRATATALVIAAATAVPVIRSMRSRYGPGRSANAVCSAPIADGSPIDALPSAAPMTSGPATPTALRSATSGSDWVRSSRAASRSNRPSAEPAGATAVMLSRRRRAGRRRRRSRGRACRAR